MMFAVLRNELFTKPIDEQYMLIDVLTIYPVLFISILRVVRMRQFCESFFDGLLAEEVITQVCRLAADIETAEIISTFLNFTQLYLTKYWFTLEKFLQPIIMAPSEN